MDKGDLAAAVGLGLIVVGGIIILYLPNNIIGLVLMMAIPSLIAAIIKVLFNFPKSVD